ncbi:tyrosine-type recombinase/integrase [Mycobacterium sp. PSTR-4-N]|uniref:tyrosine-type recombinase/integrase n=1 Tax=Mycobacterium sp. PSTR-4-N TaxID=2917745 RepID=UPI001F149A84|nr:tyrosine-type recombinase/integrase [Mycobacterium sp. PSTR-4-N]MCG7595754.1 tyrosine-type recombinase/integrase [Mycobacterium sp. PSTR-4-N]
MAAISRISSRIPPIDHSVLVPSWELTLRAERKANATIEQYTTAVRLYFRWCATNAEPLAVDRTLVKRFIADLMEAGKAPSTAGLRLQALRQFSRWLTEEGEQAEDPLLGLKPPKVDVAVVQSLTEDELRALLKACAGRTFRDRRDEAAVRLLAETGMRSGELLGLTVDDVDLVKGLVLIRHAKNHHGRMVSVGPQTAAAVDRYLRVRRQHRLANTSTLWLGDNSRGTISYHGLRDAILRRAETAGLRHFHLHKLRHTFASRWLDSGGSEGGLMATAGWRRREMLDRYVAATAAERAADEARRLNLGDL